MTPARTPLFIVLSIVLVAATAAAAVPAVNFTANPVTGNAPLPVTFTGTSTGTINGQSWYFGDEDFPDMTWESRGAAPWTGRYTGAVAVQPSGGIFLAGGVGESGRLNDAWYSSNGGDNWTLANTNANWSKRSGSSLVSLPNDWIVLMGGFDGGAKGDVWQWRGYGDNWTCLNASAWPGRSGFAAVTLPGNSIVVMGGAGTSDVWRSDDGGSNWTCVNASAGWAPRNGHRAVVLAGGSILLMGGVDDHLNFLSDVWRSADRGATWTCLTPDAGFTGRENFACGVLPDRSVVVAGGSINTDNTAANDVWRSVDGGATWVFLHEAGWDARVTPAGFLPQGDIVLLGGINSTAALNDVWRLRTASSFDANTGHTYATAGVYHPLLNVYNTEGSGVATGTVTARPLASFTFSQSAANPYLVNFTGSSTGNATGWTWYFGDEDFAGMNWTPVKPDTENASSWHGRCGHASAGLPDGSVLILGGYCWVDGIGHVYYNDVWRSTDRGATWTCINGSAGWTPRAAPSVVVLPDGGIVLSGGESADYQYWNDTWRSDDGGVTWTRVNASGGWLPRGKHAGVALPDGDIVIMAGFNLENRCLSDVWISHDRGGNWTIVNAGAMWGLRQYPASVALPDGSIVLMGGMAWTDTQDFFYKDTWISADKGLSWTCVNDNPGKASSNAAAVGLPDGSIVYMGGGGQGYFSEVWRSADRGTTWENLDGGIRWPARGYFAAASLPDGSIVLLGGSTDGGHICSDAWRLDTASSSIRDPPHIYPDLGTWRVTLGAYTSGSSNSTTLDVPVTGRTTTKIKSSRNPTHPGDTVKFTATVKAVSPATGTPAGTVQFMAGKKNIGAPVNLTAAGKAVSRPVRNLKAGVHRVTAFYSGDERFGKSNRTMKQKVA